MFKYNHFILSKIFKISYALKANDNDDDVKTQELSFLKAFWFVNNIFFNNEYSSTTIIDNNLNFLEIFREIEDSITHSLNLFRVHNVKILSGISTITVIINEDIEKAILNNILNNIAYKKFLKIKIIKNKSHQTIIEIDIQSNIKIKNYKLQKLIFELVSKYGLDCAIDEINNIIQVYTETDKNKVNNIILQLKKVNPVYLAEIQSIIPGKFDNDKNVFPFYDKTYGEFYVKIKPTHFSDNVIMNLTNNDGLIKAILYPEISAQLIENARSDHSNTQYCFIYNNVAYGRIQPSTRIVNGVVFANFVNDDPKKVFLESTEFFLELKKNINIQSNIEIKTPISIKSQYNLGFIKFIFGLIILLLYAIFLFLEKRRKILIASILSFITLFFIFFRQPMHLIWGYLLFNLFNYITSFLIKKNSILYKYGGLVIITTGVFILKLYLEFSHTLCFYTQADISLYTAAISLVFLFLTDLLTLQTNKN